ncbi:hypothetical protein WG66_003806 [Moniliophthora roreri]|nr:hypothetical protein WG66_003806 [Moniliophthora roreri]
MQHSDEPIAQTIEQRSSAGSFGQETPADIKSGQWRMFGAALKVPKTAFLRSEIPASQFQCHRKELPSPQNASTRPYRVVVGGHEIANNLDWSIHMKTGIIVYTYQGSEC